MIGGTSLIHASISERRVAAPDGTRITYYLAGEGERLLVLAPGLGTPFVAWKYLIEEFQDVYRILTWDPRGCYRSEVPRDRARLRLEDHVSDFDAICRAEGFDRFVLGGWSMGVQIALETWHRYPERVRALVLINGAYEHVLSTAFQIPRADRIFGAALRFGKRFGAVLNPAVTFVLSLDATLSLLKHTRLLVENAEFFANVLKAFSTLDWGVYIDLMLLLNEHSAAPYLGTVTVPTLVTAGTGDRMTPVETARQLQAGIPGAELFVVPNGTHYTLTEYPEILNLRIERFLRALDPEAFSTRARQQAAS